jgi:hypothetical protein
VNGKSFKENGYRPKPWVTDWNDDGVPDLLVGTCQPTKKPDGSRGPTGGPVWLCLGKKKE